MSQIKEMHFGFVPQDEEDKEANLRDEWLKQSRTVPGTQSSTALCQLLPALLKPNPSQAMNIPGMKTLRWQVVFHPYQLVPWVAMSLSRVLDYVGLAAITVMFLQPNIPAKSFAYPAHDDYLGHWRRFKLSKKDEASQALTHLYTLWVLCYCILSKTL